MTINKDISQLSDVDLSRYKDFLLDKILGRGQPDSHCEELFRSNILDSIEKVSIEVKKRNESESSDTRGNSSKSED